MARLRQLGASFTFTRADAVEEDQRAAGDAAPASPPGRRGPGGGRRRQGPAKPGAQRILDAVSLSSLWGLKVCVCV